VLPVSVVVLRSARDETLVLDEDMVVTFGPVGEQKSNMVCSAPWVLGCCVVEQIMFVYKVDRLETRLSLRSRLPQIKASA